MPNPVPSTYFPGVSLSATNDLVFTTSNASPGQVTFPELTNAEANPSSGDIRKLGYAILLAIAERHQNFSPSSSRPAFATAASAISSSDYPNHARVITMQFTVAPSGGEEVIAEPS